jgi:hypothetical protein
LESARGGQVPAEAARILGGSNGDTPRQKKKLKKCYANVSST